MKAPNILWICSDQQRWDTLGCCGNPFVRTPNLDRLAGQGTFFERAYCQNPVCTPSRASFLTGRYPRTTRCRQNGQDIPEDEVPVTRILAENGYICGLSGKLHLSACQPRACRGGERRIRDGYEEFFWSHHPTDDWPGYNLYAAWLHQHGRSYESTPHPDSRWVQVGPPEPWHHSTWCADRAIDFVRRRRRDGKPWLFSVNMFDPHHPFDPPEAYLERYAAVLDQVPLPNYEEGELDRKPPLQRVDHAGAYGGKAGFPFPKMTDLDHRLIRAAYWAMCDLIDAQVGRIVDALDETDQADNTLIIFGSDHGEMLGDHGIYLKGPYFYEPAIHVPLIAAWPDRIRAQHCSGLVELADLAPTLLDAAGLPRHPGMQSRSLWPLLIGAAGAETHRDDVYCEYYNSMDSHRGPTAHLTMVRTREHKLVVDHVHSAGELYDLASDPRERSNLWDNAGTTALRADLLLRLCNRMAWTVDPLPLRRAGW